LRGVPALHYFCASIDSGGFAMAKGQMRTPKEKKKPKSDPGKPKKVSAYKAAFSAGGAPAANPLGKKA
jgi:hypothetical protein